MSYTPSDLRQNPITGAFSWRTINGEQQTIAELSFLPNVYGFVLRDRPNPANPPVITTDDSAADVFEIITSGNPNPGQIRIDYTRGICIANIADDDKSVVVDYQGGGTNLTYQSLSEIASYGPQVNQLVNDVDDLDTRVDTLESDYSALESRVSQNEDDISTIQTEINDLVNYRDLYKFKMLGEPFPIFNNLTGVAEPPSSHFVKLTKNLTGSGQYNEGKLTSQNTVTVGNVRYYTAVINDTSSPLNGVTIPLINSTEVSNTAGTWSNQPAVIGALESAGGFFQNQIQGHKHKILMNGRGNNSINFFPGSTFASATTISFMSGSLVDVNNATGTSDVSDEENGIIRAGRQTRQDTFAAVYYIRYK